MMTVLERPERTRPRDTALRLCALAAPLSRIAQAVRFLESVSPPAAMGRLSALVAQGEQFAEHVRSFRELSTDDPRYGAILEQLEAAIATAEDELLDVDREIPGGEFAARLRRRAYEPEPVLGYLQLLSEHLRDIPQLGRRFFLVARALLTTTNTTATSRLVPPEAAKPILEWLSEDRRTDEETRGQVASFCRAVVDRMDRLRDLEHLFEGQIYLDVVGFRLALRAAITDPEVLYDLIELDHTVRSKAEELARKKNLAAYRALERLDEEEERAWSVLSLPERAQRARRRKVSGQSERREAVPHSLPRARTGRRSAVLRIVAFLVLTIGGIDLLIVYGGGASLPSLSSAELQKLSPYLETGAISEGAGDPVFVGRLVPSRWHLLSASDRSNAADALRGALKERGVRGAMVSVEGRPAILIEQGRLVLSS